MRRPTTSNVSGLRAKPRPGPLRTVLADVLRASVAAFLFYCVLFNLSVVRGNSMAPGIQDGDRILVEPWSYVLDDIDYGDVIVMRYPLDPTVDYIKRVVGLPGDEVYVCNGMVWVNGRLLDEPYVEFSGIESPMLTVVREDSYFVMGDNRPRSSDSREFGLVPAEYVRGRVDVRLWPPQRAGLVR